MQYLKKKQFYFETSYPSKYQTNEQDARSPHYCLGSIDYVYSNITRCIKITMNVAPILENALKTMNNNRHFVSYAGSQ